MKIEDALAAIWAMHLIQIGTGNQKTAEKIKSIHDAVNFEIDRLTRELEAAKRDAGRYRWLRDKSVPPHNFYVSVPTEFAEERYKPQDVDAYIDAAIAKANN
jgi:hypothetical protein